MIFETLVFIINMKIYVLTPLYGHVSRVIWIIDLLFINKILYYQILDNKAVADLKKLQ